MGRKGVFLFLFLSWSLSLTFAVLPAFDVGHMIYNNYVDTIPLPADQKVIVNRKDKIAVGVAAGVKIVLIIIQLASFVFYLPIFIVAKRSGVNVGIRETQLLPRK